MSDETLLDKLAKHQRKWASYSLVWKDWLALSLNSPSGWKFAGAIVALVGASPFVGATFLARSLGDLPTIICLIVGIVIGIAAGAVLFAKAYLMPALWLFAFAVGSGLALWVTVGIGWG
jgi:hypothetical protein